MSNSRQRVLAYADGLDDRELVIREEFEFLRIVSPPSTSMRLTVRWSIATFFVFGFLLFNCIRVMIDEPAERMSVLPIAVILAVGLVVVQGLLWSMGRTRIILQVDPRAVTVSRIRFRREISMVVFRRDVVRRVYREPGGQRLAIDLTGTDARFYPMAPDAATADQIVEHINRALHSIPTRTDPGDPEIVADSRRAYSDGTARKHFGTLILIAGGIWISFVILAIACGADPGGVICGAVTLGVVAAMIPAGIIMGTQDKEYWQ